MRLSTTQGSKKLDPVTAFTVIEFATTQSRGYTKEGIDKLLAKFILHVFCVNTHPMSIIFFVFASTFFIIPAPPTHQSLR